METARLWGYHQQQALFERHKLKTRSHWSTTGNANSLFCLREQRDQALYVLLA